MKTYPVAYTVLNFQKFNSRRGNTIKHVSRFVDAMGPFAHNPKLCLREFSKSLTDRAYVWYLNLKLGLIPHHLVTLFNPKFFCGEAKFTLAELGLTRQYPGRTWIFIQRGFAREPWTAVMRLMRRQWLMYVCTAWSANGLPRKLDIPFLLEVDGSCSENQRAGQKAFQAKH